MIGGTESPSLLTVKSIVTTGGAMTKITQIEDRSAASAWSPIREYADVIAIGAKVRQLTKVLFESSDYNFFLGTQKSLAGSCFGYRTRVVQALMRRVAS